MVSVYGDKYANEPDCLLCLAYVYWNISLQPQSTHRDLCAQSKDGKGKRNIQKRKKKKKEVQAKLLEMNREVRRSMAEKRQSWETKQERAGLLVYVPQNRSGIQYIIS